MKKSHSTEATTTAAAIHKVLRKMQTDLTVFNLKRITLRFSRTVGDLVAVNAEIQTGKQ